MGFIYNLFGGPNSGKTSTALKTCGRLRELGYKIELPRPIPIGLSEAIKHWAYRDIKLAKWDQQYIWSNQLFALDYLFQSGIEHIISDSPLILQCMYAKFHERPYWQQLLQMTQMYENDHTICNIFLERGNFPYEKHGRYETEEEGRAMDDYILNFCKEYEIEIEKIPLKRYDLVERAIYRCMGDG